MYAWEIVVEAWPYATGAGQEEDQKACGPRQATLVWNGADMKGAMGVADVISETLKHNPRVWQAPIFSIRRMR